jgi:hypothetical protein
MRAAGHCSISLRQTKPEQEAASSSDKESQKQEVTSSTTEDEQLSLDAPESERPNKDNGMSSEHIGEEHQEERHRACVKCAELRQDLEVLRNKVSAARASEKLAGSKVRPLEREIKRLQQLVADKDRALAQSTAKVEELERDTRQKSVQLASETAALQERIRLLEKDQAETPLPLSNSELRGLWNLVISLRGF